LADAVIDQELYDAIISRRSVRRYADKSVPEETRRQIAEFAMRVKPLVPENRFSYSVLPIEGKSEELAVVMGGYGKLVSARHLLLPRIQGDASVLEDFGYRVEQLVVELTRLGLGSCYIGSLGHEAEALDRFGSPPGERMPAVVVFGFPSTATAGRGFNRMIRSAIGADRSLQFDKFVFCRGTARQAAPASSFSKPAELNPFQEKIMDALRHAPSAGNSRPWRVVIHEGLAYFCVTQNTPYYRMARAVRLGYHLLDAGIGMANVSLAMAALGREAQWELVGDQPEVRRMLNLPPEVQLIGTVRLN
jgi:nitroreductase